MQVIGYIRVSTEEQDLAKQEHLLLKYAQQQGMAIDDFIQVEISSRRNTRERRIDELLARLEPGDILLVAELSRLGRNMFEVIHLINQLSERGVKLVFVRQPELSTAGPHGKLLLAIYSYFAEAEREFISVRTKQGLAAARARGRQLGRPKGSRDRERILDPQRETIKEYLQLKIPLRRIRAIVNPHLERPISYPAYRYFVHQDPELLALWQAQRVTQADLPTFTAAAQRLWTRLPQPIQRKVLDHVWCSTCGKTTTMVQYSGQVREGDLLLTGLCAACGNKVVRLLESE
jgi:DNA invertase Pin-like site-specific DNA recombinase